MKRFLMEHKDSMKPPYISTLDGIDIAGNFIQKNTSQIRKSLISPKHIMANLVNTSQRSLDTRKVIMPVRFLYFGLDINPHFHHSSSSS